MFARIRQFRLNQQARGKAQSSKAELTLENSGLSSKQMGKPGGEGAAIALLHGCRIPSSLCPVRRCCREDAQGLETELQTKCTDTGGHDLVSIWPRFGKLVVFVACDFDGQPTEEDEQYTHV